MLPSLLKGLEDKVWRTKQGSVQLLGAMAHCAPKQLGSCLPTIVPRLGDVLGDPHPKVQSAAQEALNEVGGEGREQGGEGEGGGGGRGQGPVGQGGTGGGGRGQETLNEVGGGGGGAGRT